MKPSTDNEWDIHSINIHGVFFERWCEKAIEESPGWKIRSTNYPVEFPPPNGPIRGRESSLDIRAERQQDDLRITLIIECKKNNPAFINWIFFSKHSGKNTSLFLRHLQNIPRIDSPEQWTVGNTIRAASHSAVVTDEARETRGSYVKVQQNDKTKTSNAAVTEAAYQVALATQALAAEESEFSGVLGASNPPPPMPWKEQIILPMIITTARLFTCAFDAKDVDPKSGEIPLHKASLSEQSHLYFEYPIPRHLQVAPKNLAETLKKGSIESFMRQHIMIVQSESLGEVLADLAKGGNG